MIDHASKSLDYSSALLQVNFLRHGGTMRRPSPTLSIAVFLRDGAAELSLVVVPWQKQLYMQKIYQVCQLTASCGLASGHLLSSLLSDIREVPAPHGPDDDLQATQPIKRSEPVWSIVNASKGAWLVFAIKNSAGIFLSKQSQATSGSCEWSARSHYLVTTLQVDD